MGTEEPTASPVNLRRLRPSRRTPTRPDWDLAAATAARFGPTGPRVSRAEAAEVVADLRSLADEAVAHVESFTGLSGVTVPSRVIDRPTWAAINIAGLSSLIKIKTNFIGAKVTAVQAGALLGYLSGKVLGQYEVFSTDPGQLLLVAPNIVAVERRLGANPRDFRLWVCLHEVTHRIQFTAVPWLRSYFMAEVQAYINASDSFHFKPRAGASLLDSLQSPQQKEILDRLTCLLTLLEGHAEFVMDGVGPQVIPSVATIRAGFDKRRQAANPLEQFLRSLIGIDIKLKQYEQGNKFVKAIVDQSGMDAFNRIWTSPDTLPQLPELSNPSLWMDRVLA